ncbi:hypothetical protein TNCV_2824381 [Trichonephila clavipes]|nr:hypothetical protein TNCV_2824381 [Trichonephila clavipes]
MDLKRLKQSFVSEAKADKADSELLRVVSISVKSLPEHQTMMASANMPNFPPVGGVFSMPAKNSEKRVGQRTGPFGTPCPITTGSEKSC